LRRFDRDNSRTETLGKNTDVIPTFAPASTMTFRSFFSSASSYTRRTDFIEHVDIGRSRAQEQRRRIGVRPDAYNPCRSRCLNGAPCLAQFQTIERTQRAVSTADTAHDPVCWAIRRNRSGEGCSRTARRETDLSVTPGKRGSEFFESGPHPYLYGFVGEVSHDLTFVVVVATEDHIA
jgi:hypothetical protein